jgi:hypothetical protein
MGWFADFFFGKSKETLEAMKQDRERQIEKLQVEIAEIDALIEKSED